MTTARLLIVFGVLVLVSPYLGLPYSWLMFLLPVLGVVILALGVRLHQKARKASAPAPYDTQQSV